MAHPDDLDDDTIRSAGSPLVANQLPIADSPEGLDEKTLAVSRRALNTAAGSAQGARVAFAPAQRRERYAVRHVDPTLTSAVRTEVGPVPARPVSRAARSPRGERVIAAVVAITLLTAGAVGGILALVFRS